MDGDQKHDDAKRITHWLPAAEPANPDGPRCRHCGGHTGPTNLDWARAEAARLGFVVVMNGKGEAAVFGR